MQAVMRAVAGASPSLDKLENRLPVAEAVSRPQYNHTQQEAILGRLLGDDDDDGDGRREKASGTAVLNGMPVTSAPVRPVAPGIATESSAMLRCAALDARARRNRLSGALEWRLRCR
jgi:hypothetical protein